MLAVQAAGWLLYAAGLMGAIAFVVVRAADGAISLGTVLMAVSLIRRSRDQLASAAPVGALVATLATADRLFWLEDHAAARPRWPARHQAPDRLRVRDPLARHVVRATRTPNGPCFDASTSCCPPVRRSRSSARTAPARPRWSSCCSACTSRRRARSWSTTCRWPRSPDAWRARCTAAFQDFARFHLPAVESVGVADLPELHDRNR